MAKVVGIGGIFVQAKDPQALRAWYADALGLDIQSWGGAQLHNEAGTYGVWTALARTSDYFKPSEKEFMINLRVDDLDGILATLRHRGANVLDRREETDDGSFGYVLDPEGTLIELWQPRS
jgi:predicted enzyme related to lactoylglutathione lyase